MPMDIHDWSFSYMKHDISGLSFLSYVVDWIVYVAILTVAILFGSVIPPWYHEFLTNDISLMYSHVSEEDTVIPINILLVITVVLPLLQFVLCALYSPSSGTRRAWDIFAGLTCLCGSMATQLMITCVLKNICGLPRPDLLSRCQADIDLVPDEGLLTVAVCTNDNIFLLQEGFRSFPSGHLSTVFCGMVVTSLNIAGKFQVFDKRAMSTKIFLTIVPIIVACFVACTRISDNRHFLRDVVGGAIIGSSAAVWFYSQCFPSVFHLENAGRAYPPRRFGVAAFFNNVGGFWALREKIPGSFMDRILNTRSTLELLKNSDPIVNGEIDNPDELVNIQSNIRFLNRIAPIFKNRTLNLNTKQEETSV